METNNVYDDADIPRDEHGYYMALWLTVRCQNDTTHELGKAIQHLAGPKAGVTEVGNGLRWDEFGKAVADCPECGKLTGSGKDQRISRKRLDARFDELRLAGNRSGKVQV